MTLLHRLLPRELAPHRWASSFKTLVVLERRNIIGYIIVDEVLLIRCTHIINIYYVPSLMIYNYFYQFYYLTIHSFTQ